MQQKFLFLLVLVPLITLSPATAAVFEVGPGKPHATIGSVPFYALAPGDTVPIHYQAAPYREILNISTRGTATSPIRIIGVPGPKGEQPVIDGQDANVSANMHFAYPTGTPRRGVVVVGPSTEHGWGTKPGYIEIAGLTIRNANKNYGFTNANGSRLTYTSNASSIFVERGEHITVRNCTLTGSGNGFFVASGSEEVIQSRDILFEKNRVYNNGNPGSYLEHNLYTECIGLVIQYNYFGFTTPGAIGNNLKDRSAGTVIRYNWFEASQGGHIMDLVNPQEGGPQEVYDPSFHQTFVYGNIIYNGPQPNGSTYMIHYGGDDGNTIAYRKGTLFFYNNTVIVECNQTGPGSRWRTILLRLETNGESTDVRNNIILNKPATPGATPTALCLLNTEGHARVYANWMSSSVRKSHDSLAFIGTVSGWENLYISPTNDPGFVDFAAHDFHLRSGAEAIDRGVALAPEVFSNPAGKIYDVTSQYAVHAAEQARPTAGAARDFGGFEFYGSSTPAPSPSPSPVASPIPSPMPSPVPSPSPSPKPSVSPTPIPTPTPTPRPSPSLSPTPGPVQTTVAFQQGINGYSGAEDQTISNLYTNYSWNNGEGVTTPDGEALYLRNGSLQSGSFESRSLVKFKGLSIPAGRTIVSATLTINFINWAGTGTVTGYYLNTPWNGSSAKAVSWKRRDLSLNWTTPGASGQGSDLIAGKSFSVSGFTTAGSQSRTIQLDAAVIQRWIDNPSTNQGIVLFNSTPGWLVRASASEDGSIALRPRLTITYK